MLQALLAFNFAGERGYFPFHVRHKWATLELKMHGAGMHGVLRRTAMAMYGLIGCRGVSLG